jgi:D-threo-aldose 1-dehydrogenase
MGYDPTERVALGTSGLRVTRLGLGTAPLGGLYRALGDDEAAGTVARALELGLRFFDTAPQYGHGLAEMRLGRGLRDVAREDIVVATKVGRLLRDVPYTDSVRYYHGTPDVNPVFDFSEEGVRRSVAESLERLGLDRVDILHIHDPDEHGDEALEGAFKALDAMRAEGAIGAVGAGMNQTGMLVRFAREADFDCFLLAGRYTLLDQEGLAELLPLCAERGIAIIAGGIYNSGLLADPKPGAPYNYVPADETRLARALALEAVCRRHGVPLRAAAIQFPLAHAAVSCVVTGARTAAEIADNEQMLRFDIPPDLWQELRALALLPENAPTPA